MTGKIFNIFWDRLRRRIVPWGFLVLFSASLGFLIGNFEPVSPSYAFTGEPVCATDAPISIEIPKLNKNLTIKSAQIVGQQWATYKNAVSWYQYSSNPSKGGNVVLWGHNKASIFGNLKKLKAGDEIILKTASYTYRYVVFNTVTTSGQDMRYVNAKGDVITIYTCSGWMDSKRLFVIAKSIRS